MTQRAWWIGLAAIMAAILSTASVPSQAERIEEVEAARANARAGGPTNARDAELLERYGTLSGTPKRDWRTGERVQHKRKAPRRRDDD